MGLILLKFLDQVFIFQVLTRIIDMTRKWGKETEKTEKLFTPVHAETAV